VGLGGYRTRCDPVHTRDVLGLCTFSNRQWPHSIGRARDPVAGERSANVVSERCPRVAARLGDAAILLGNRVADHGVDLCLAGK